MSSQVRRIRVDALVEDMDVGSVLALGESTEQALGVLGLILPGEERVVERARGVASNDHRGVEGELVEAAQHDVEGGAFWTCVAMSAKHIETVDVVAERPSARARRLRGRSHARARHCRCVRFWRVREGGAAPGGFCGRVSRAQRRLRRLRRSQHFRRPPSRRASGDALRGGRATRNNPQHGASSRAQPAPARARRDACLERFSVKTTSCSGWRGVGEQDKWRANLDTYPSAHT